MAVNGNKNVILRIGNYISSYSGYIDRVFEKYTTRDEALNALRHYMLKTDKYKDCEYFLISDAKPVKPVCHISERS